MPVFWINRVATIGTVPPNIPRDMLYPTENAVFLTSGGKFSTKNVGSIDINSDDITANTTWDITMILISPDRIALNKNTEATEYKNVDANKNGFLPYLSDKWAIIGIKITKTNIAKLFINKAFDISIFNTLL